jgi:hypothetical protein
MGYGSMTKVTKVAAGAGIWRKRSLFRSPLTQPKVGFITAILTVSRAHTEQQQQQCQHSSGL